MTRMDRDRRRCILTIAALVSFGCIQACDKQSNKSQDEQIHDIYQGYIDSGMIVCRDGTAYLTNGFDRSLWITPYILNGHFVKCNPDRNHLVEFDTRNS